jgi:hypothetical protein
MTNQETPGAQDAPGAAPSAGPDAAENKGQPAPEQAAETHGASPAAEKTQEFGQFAAARGSGLSRGKRALHTPPTPPGSDKTEYRPTAIEVVTPVREYQNPFEEPKPKEIPAKPEDAAAAPVAAPDVSEAELPQAPPPVEAPEAAAKAELDILPPAEPKRTPMSWEHRPAERPAGLAPRPPREDRRESRPPFGSEPQRRRERFGDGPGRDRGAGRDAFPERAGRQPPSQPAVEAPKKTGGILGWIKGIFGGKKTPAEADRPEYSDRGGYPQRRRHRGGRGRSGGPSGQPQGQSSGGQPYPRGREDRGDAPGDFRRHRHRGGRGRYRGDRGGPRPEGQQGGGHI